MTDEQFESLMSELRYLAKLTLGLACGRGTLIVILLFHFKYD